MVNGTELVLHTNVVFGRHQKSVEVIRTIRDRVKVLPLKIVDEKAKCLPLFDTEKTTVVEESVTDTEVVVEVIKSRAENVTAHYTIACAHGWPWTAQEVLKPLIENVISKLCEMIGYSDECHM